MIVLYIYVTYLAIKVNSFKYLHGNQFTNGYSGRSPLHSYKASITNIPYHVLIVYTNQYCSGTLLRSKVIVTAASCFIRWKKEIIVVKVGAEMVTGLGQVIEVVELKKHEYFGYSSSMDNDIALLMLKEHVVFSLSVQKIIMIEPEISLLDDSTLDVSGWGSANHQPTKYAGFLLRSEMTLINMDKCKKHYPYLITRSNFCVRYTPERLLSDNGGSAVFREVLVGILSFGASNTEEPYVAVLTNISYFHKWINLNTKRFMTKYCSPPVENYNMGYADFLSDEHELW